MTEPQKTELRLLFQGSIPVESSEIAEEWYKMLKELVKHQSPSSTLNGQIMKMLEPCCGDKTQNPLSGRVANIRH